LKICGLGVSYLTCGDKVFNGLGEYFFTCGEKILSGLRDYLLGD
jgi:hypothetical protein